MIETTLNYIQMAELINTTPKNFLKMTKRYEEKLIKQGYLFTKSGKGKKAIYTIIRHKEDMAWNEMDLKQKLEYIFDYKVSYPSILVKYITYLYNNINDIKYMTDIEVAIELKYSKKSDYIIRKCRNELINNGFMQELNKYDCDYYLLNYIEEKRIRTGITESEYHNYWQNYFYEEVSTQKIEYLTNHTEVNNISKKIMKQINYNAFMYMSSIAGGYVCKCKARILNESFFILAESIIHDIVYIKEYEDKDILNNLYSKL